MNGKEYLPVLLCALLVLILLAANPKCLKGKTYGDAPKDCPDPIMTALLVALVGCALVYFMNQKN